MPGFESRLANNKLTKFKGGKAAQTVPITYRVNSMSLSPDDAEVALACDDGKLRIFATANLEQKGIVEMSGPVLSTSYASTGKLVVASDKSGQTFVVDRATLQPLNPAGWKYHSAKINAVTFNPSATAVATASLDSHIIIWKDSARWESDNRLKLEFTHYGGVVASSFVTDTTLLSAGDDRVIRLWNV